MRLLSAVLLILALALPAAAQPIPGAGAPAFAQARDLWLAGEDLPALQALAGLAREGNTAAQMLLSQIATATWTHAHVTEGLDRRERIALLRQEGGISGRDWMQVAVENNPLAQVYWASRSPERDPVTAANRILWLVQAGDSASALKEIGEMGSAGNYEEMALVARTYRDALGIAADYHLAEALGWFSLQRPARYPAGIHTEAAFMRYFATLRTPETILEATGWIEPETVSVEALINGTARGEALRLIRQSPSLQPLQGFCAATCPGAEDACLTSAFVTLRPSFPQPLSSVSPALVPTAEYQASPRFFRDVRARLEQGAIVWPGCPG